MRKATPLASEEGRERRKGAHSISPNQRTTRQRERRYNLRLDSCMATPSFTIDYLQSILKTNKLYLKKAAQARTNLTADKGYDRFKTGKGISEGGILMNFKMEKVGDITVVRLEEGKLLYDNLEPLHQGLYDLIDKGSIHIVLNLSKISYIDSFSVGFLMDIYRRLANQKGRVALAGVQPRVKTILALTRVDEVISLYKTEQEATESFAGKD